MCFIGLIGKEQLPCCISTIFLSSTASAYETALCAIRGTLAVPFFVQRKRKGLSVHVCLLEPVFLVFCFCFLLLCTGADDAALMIQQHFLLK